MLDPAPEVESASRHSEPGRLGLPTLLQFGNLLREFWRHTFVGVEIEDPVVASLLGGVVLLRCVTRPGSNEDAISELASDLNRAIRTFGIDDDDLIRPRQRLQRVGDVVLFVVGDDGRSDFHT